MLQVRDGDSSACHKGKGEVVFRVVITAGANGIAVATPPHAQVYTPGGGERGRPVTPCGL